MIPKKYIIIGCTLFVLFIVGLSIYLLIPRSYINFATAPEQVSILIDGKDKYSVNNGDTITITPGKHNVIVYRDEFNPYEKEIDVHQNQTVNFIAALMPLTDSARAILNSSPNTDAVIQKFTGEVMTKETDIMAKKYPILIDLPIERRLYMISACPSVKHPDDPTSIALCIDITISDDTEANLRSDALLSIEDRGYDPNDYEIIWNVIPYPDL